MFCVMRHCPRHCVGSCTRLLAEDSASLWVVTRNRSVYATVLPVLPSVKCKILDAKSPCQWCHAFQTAKPFYSPPWLTENDEVRQRRSVIPAAPFATIHPFSH